MQPSKYIWDKIEHLNGTVTTTREIEDAVKTLFTEIGAVSAPYKYPLPEGPFPAYICTSVNEVKCHGIPNCRVIDWSKDIVNVDISFKWRGQYYDTCQSWGNHPLSLKSKQLTHQVASHIKSLEFQISPWEIGAFTQKCAKDLNVEVLREFGGHGIGSSIHMIPFIPAIPTGSTRPLTEYGNSFTVEPIVYRCTPAGCIYAQTEIQLWRT